MSDPNDRIDRLEAQIEELKDQLLALDKELVDAQLDAWRSRIDELELQAHLASMEARESVGPLVATLRDRWIETRDQLGELGGSASGALANLRGGLDQAAQDLRAALRDAASAVRTDD